MAIHETAIVGDGAKIPPSAEIGPFCQIGPNVVLGENVTLRSHVLVDGHTKIGDGTSIYPFSTVGLDPQHLKYAGEPSGVSIGRNCLIREHVTIHRGTQIGRMVTEVGDRCMLMVAVHVAHDCTVGNDVIMANNVTLGGHCTVGNNVTLGGLSAVQQFVRIGDLVIVGGLTGVHRDIIPYTAAVGFRAELTGINIVGLKRAGIAKSEIHHLRKAYRLLFRPGRPVMEGVKEAEAAFADDKNVSAILEFIQQSNKSICTPRRGISEQND